MAKGVEWPVGPTPEALHRQNGGDRNSESSDGSAVESFESSLGGSSPASSIHSTPSKGSFVPLQGIEDVSLDQKEMTVRVLSRLRDLWEVSNGWICLEDSYEMSPKKEKEVEKVEGLGITVDTTKMTPEEKRKSMDVVKKVMGEQNSKRANIVREIIETEETYIRGLQELVDVPPPENGTNRPGVHR